WEPAVRHAVSDEGPAAIAGKAMPGDLGFCQLLGAHGLDRVAPQSQDPADSPAVQRATHRGDLVKGALTVSSQRRAWRIRSAAAPLDGGFTLPAAALRRQHAQQTTNGRRGQAPVETLTETP